MKKAERFEDLISWQKARELTKNIYQVTKSQPFANDFGLSSQIQRLAVSVMSNIAEEFDRDGRAEIHQFHEIAKGSVAEVRSQLYVALDAEYIKPDQFIYLKSLSEETARIIGGLRVAVQKQRDQ